MHQTTKYALNLIDPSDDLSPDPLNENMNKIETELDGCSRLVFGTYKGDGERTQKIDLGFTPKALMIVDDTGTMGNANRIYGGLVFSDTVLRSDIPPATIEENGFTVYQGGNSWQCTNESNRGYYYIAFC